MRIRVRGARELAADLARLGRRLESEPMTGPAAPVADVVRGQVPKRSGRLASTTHVKPAGPRHAQVVVGPTAYAAVIARGWPGHNIEANPFDVRGAAAGDLVAGQAMDRQVQAWCSDVRGA